MFKHLSMIMTLLVSFVLTSCAVDSGNSKLAKTNSTAIDSILIRGETTQAQVKGIFGDPCDTDIMIDGRSKWTYTHIKRSEKMSNYIPVANWFSQGTNDTKRKLVIIFKDGVVDDFSSSQAKGETKVGLF